MTQVFHLNAKDTLDSSEGKRLYNEKHFAESAPRYDIATRGLSFGRDASWKRHLIEGLPAMDRPVCVDVACGTGDVTFLLAGKYQDGEILGVDLTAEMINIARQRNQNPNVRFAVRDMSRLALPDHSVDILTGSYAIRNAPDLEEVIREFRRVMKPGGHLAFLDFSKPKGRLAKKIQYLMLKIWGSFWGLVLHGNPEVHGYISSSIRDFPDHEQLQILFKRCGFGIEKSRPFLMGMMRLYFLTLLPIV